MDNHSCCNQTFVSKEALKEHKKNMHQMNISITIGNESGKKLIYHYILIN